MATLDGVVDELAELKARFPSPDAALVDELLRRVSKWREDDTDLEALVHDLDGTLSQVRFSNHERKAQVSLALAKLRDAVGTVGGMTINERLFVFGLLERWDRTAVPKRAALRAKLLA
jgi:hypothetical protein